MTTPTKTATLMRKLASFDCIVSIRESSGGSAAVTIEVLPTPESASAIAAASAVAEEEGFKVSFTLLEEG